MNTLVASLRIDDAHLADIGKYVCKGENIVGQDQTEAMAFVLNTANIDERPFINPEAFYSLEKVPDKEPNFQIADPIKGKPPKFIVPLPKEIKLEEGEKMRIKFKVEGYPFPKVNKSLSFPINDKM